MSETAAPSPQVAAVMAASGHGAVCAASALEQAYGDHSGAVVRLEMWGKSCGQHCLPGSDLLSRYAALSNGSVYAQRRAARLAAITTARLA